MIKGIDISAVQPPNINFKAVYDAGNRFIIIRCGVGNDGIDHLYSGNVKAARIAGLKIAAYHVIYPLRNDPAHPGRSPIEQANAHFKFANGEIACCDFEWPAPEDWAKNNINADFIREWLWQYLEEYSRLSGRAMILYTYPFYANTIKLDAKFAKYPLWIASYKTTTPQVPTPWGKDDWVIWQNSGGDVGKLPSGAPVDTDICKDLSIFDNTIHHPQPVPNTPPAPVSPSPQPSTKNTFFTFIVKMLKALLHIN